MTVPSTPLLHVGSHSGFFVLTRTKILLFFSLVVTWTIAHLLPTYQPTIKSHVREQLNLALQSLPEITVDWSPNRDPREQFNASKVALLIEGRPLPSLVPQLLHMIATVPPDWRFVFIGTNKSVATVSRSFATQYQQVNGKLDLMVLPRPWKVDSKEDVYRMLTDIRFYDEFLPDVEWILKFEPDSVLCSRSQENLNDWLDYDWAGAPKQPGDKFAGHGGLSLRRVSTVKRILNFQSRYNDTEAEDEWFGKRIVVLPGARSASGTNEDHFSIEKVYHQNPIGIHVPKGGTELPDGVWRDPAQRRDIFSYCPEVMMIMPMKVERERCEGDNMRGEIVTEAKDKEEDKKELKEMEEEGEKQKQREKEKAEQAKHEKEKENEKRAEDTVFQR